MITENLSTLKIHKLSQEQFERERDAGRLDQNALYLTPDEEIDVQALLNTKITIPSNVVAGDLLTYDGVNWTRISKADLIAEIIAALPRAEEATF